MYEMKQIEQSANWGFIWSLELGQKLKGRTNEQTEAYNYILVAKCYKEIVGSGTFTTGFEIMNEQQDIIEINSTNVWEWVFFAPEIVACTEVFFIIDEKGGLVRQLLPNTPKSSHKLLLDDYPDGYKIVEAKDLPTDTREQVALISTF